MSLRAWEQQGTDVLLRVRVQPKASRNAWHMTPDGQLRIALTAPPVDGEANDGLITFLAKTLHIPKNRVQLEHGQKSRDKSVRVVNAQLDEISLRFTPHETEGKH